MIFRDHRGMGLPFAHVTAPDDVLLVDHEAPGPVYDELFSRCKRAFLYPHGCGPLVYTLYPQRPETRGHFVIGTGQADLLAEFDARPSEVVGWPYSPICRWQPTEGRKVLFAPTHPDGFGWLPPEVLDVQADITRQLEGLDVEVRARTADSHVPIADALAWADVVVAAPGSFPSFAVAAGIPTVVYGEHLAPRERHPVTREVVTVEEWDDLWPSFKFPVADGDLGEQIDAACQIDMAEGWRERFIGYPFDAEEFSTAFAKAVEKW